jgi:hypothetical protein
MLEVGQRAQCRREQLVAATTTQVGDESRPARVALVAGLVETASPK